MWCQKFGDLINDFLLLAGSTPKPMMISQDNFHVLNEGESIELYCDFYQDDYDLFHQPVLWLKQQQNEESPINIMGNINDPFLQTERYSVDFVENTAPRYRLLLRITGQSLTFRIAHQYHPKWLLALQNWRRKIRVIILAKYVVEDQEFRLMLPTLYT